MSQYTKNDGGNPKKSPPKRENTPPLGSKSRKVWFVRTRFHFSSWSTLMILLYTWISRPARARSGAKKWSRDYVFRQFALAPCMFSQKQHMQSGKRKKKTHKRKRRPRAFQRYRSH